MLRQNNCTMYLCIVYIIVSLQPPQKASAPRSFVAHSNPPPRRSSSFLRRLRLQAAEKLSSSSMFHNATFCSLYIAVCTLYSLYGRERCGGFSSSESVANRGRVFVLCVARDVAVAIASTDYTNRNNTHIPTESACVTLLLSRAPERARMLRVREIGRGECVPVCGLYCVMCAAGFACIQRARQAYLRFERCSTEQRQNTRTPHSSE